MAAFGCRILDIRNRLPFAGFAGDQDFDVVLLESLDLFIGPRRAGKKRNWVTRMVGSPTMRMARAPVRPRVRPQPGRRSSVAA